MFLHLSVSHSVHMGDVCFSAYWDTPSPGLTPPSQTPPRQTPQLARHPPPLPRADTPPNRQVVLLNQSKGLTAI